MAKYNFTAIMSLQLVAMATLIACATASMEEQVSSSKYGKWAERNKMMTEHVKLSSSEEQIKSPSSSAAAEEEKHNKESCAAASPAEHDKAKTDFLPRWSAEEMENMSDNQLREVAASLMVEKDAPIAFHGHPKHQCWQKCAFEKLRPYCEQLLIQSSIQGCLLAGGKACALYCTGGSLK